MIITTAHAATAHAATAHAADAAHHSGSLLESTDFWYGVAFVLFVVLLVRPILKALFGILDHRIENISHDIEGARAEREEAQNLLATYKRKQRDALEEAEDILSSAKKEATRLRDEAQKDLEHSLKARQEQALQKIEMAEVEALNQVKSAAADIALAAAQTMIKDKMDDKALDKITDQAIDDLPKDLSGQMN